MGEVSHRVLGDDGIDAGQEGLDFSFHGCCIVALIDLAKQTMLDLLSSISLGSTTIVWALVDFEDINFRSLDMDITWLVGTFNKKKTR
jgi:hypothetical protein